MGMVWVVNDLVGEIHLGSIYIMALPVFYMFCCYNWFLQRNVTLVTHFFEPRSLWNVTMAALPLNVNRHAHLHPVLHVVDVAHFVEQWRYLHPQAPAARRTLVHVSVFPE